MDLFTSLVPKLYLGTFLVPREILFRANQTDITAWGSAMKLPQQVLPKCNLGTRNTLLNKHAYGPAHCRLISLALLVYLIVAMLWPEKF